MAALFARVFGDGQVLREWFAQLVLYSDVVTLSGVYEDFFALAQGVLRMVGDIHKVEIHASDMEELRTRMLNMPAHRDVPDGLSLLKDAGFRLVTLTNSPPVQRVVRWSMLTSRTSLSANLASIPFGSSNLRKRFIRWWRPHWILLYLRSAWLQHMCGTQSARKVWVTRERSSRDRETHRCW